MQLGKKNVIDLYIFLKKKENELNDSLYILLNNIEKELYESFSIEELENLVIEKDQNQVPSEQERKL